jgi:hypothetical protein
MKVTLLGASDVCKHVVAQALAQHAVQDPPPRVPEPPISGVGFYGLRFHAKPELVMCLWDVPSAGAYREMAESNVKTSDVILILTDMYDVTTLPDAEFWLQYASRVKHTFYRPTVILVGCSLGNAIGKLRRMTSHQLTALAANHNAKYREIFVSQSVGFGELITAIIQHELQPHSRELSPHRGYQTVTTDFEEVSLQSDAETETEEEENERRGILLNQDFWSFFVGCQSCLYWLG